MSVYQEAAVLLAKCPKAHKSYGIRAELSAKNRWRLTWAFPVKESSAGGRATTHDTMLSLHMVL